MMKQASFLVGAFLWMVAPAYAQSWSNDYYIPQEPGDIHACIAQVEYKNAYFSIRLQEEYVDFYFFRTDFTLPYNTNLGTMIIKFNINSFRMNANTNPRSYDRELSYAQGMFLSMLDDDFVVLLDSLRLAQSAQLVFPNGSSYRLGLHGSNRSIKRAIDCWFANVRGGRGVNPFDDGSSATGVSGGANNPFQY